MDILIEHNNIRLTQNLGMHVKSKERKKKKHIGSVWIQFILLKTENWIHCSKIIFKCINNTVGLIFNICFWIKWLWVPWTVCEQWLSLLMIVLYHQIKIPFDFWCRRGLNPRSLIQPSEALLVELTGTYY